MPVLIADLPPAVDGRSIGSERRALAHAPSLPCSNRTKRAAEPHHASACNPPDFSARRPDESTRTRDVTDGGGCDPETGTFVGEGSGRWQKALTARWHWSPAPAAASAKRPLEPWPIGALP